MSTNPRMTVDDFLSHLAANGPQATGVNGNLPQTAANSPQFGAAPFNTSQASAGGHANAGNSANLPGSNGSGASQNSSGGGTNGSVGPGGRNKYLTSLAGSYRARGMSQSEIEPLLLVSNRILCSPPLSDFEVRLIAASVSKYPPPRTNAGIAKSLNDIGNAERFVRHFADDARYVPEFGKWLVWDQDRWVIDAHQTRLMILAKTTVQDIYKEIDVLPVPDQGLVKRMAKHANDSHHVARVKAMLAIACQDSAIVAPAASLDSNPMLLGVANGVIELTTGQIRPYKRDDLITRTAPVEYDPSAKCPQFIKFLKRITSIFDHVPEPKERQAKHREFIDYLQRVIGYSLTALTAEQVLFFFFGSGANGKTTFLNVLSALLGNELAKQTQPETLMEVRHGKSSINNDIARLQGSRLVLANETGESQFLSEPLVKQLTGGDQISARFLYREHFEFTPRFKLIISGNHKPVIRGTDHGIWRRIQLVPFGVTIPKKEQDKNLEKRLCAELPGILNWAIKGCLAWQRDGLRPPKVVTDAIKEYREEMDVIGHWIEERCEIDPTAVTDTSDLYLDFKLWAEGNGLSRLPLVTFSRKLADRGLEKFRSNKARGFRGIKRANGIRSFGPTVSTQAPDVVVTGVTGSGANS